MPGVDGIGASQQITEIAPTVQIIIMSVQSDPNYLRRAMMAGARDFLTKPFGGDELTAAIRRVHEKRPARSVAPVSYTDHGGSNNTKRSRKKEGTIITIYSPKGGTGCSSIAINVAVTLAKRGHRTVLVDGSLQFGDISVMLNMKTMTSLADLSGERGGELDAELISSIVQVHRTDLNVLLAPPRPEMADMITEESLTLLLQSLRQQYEFVIVDTASHLSEKTLALLDVADRILLVTQQSLPALKNVSRFFDLTESLDYSMDKVWMIVNQASNKHRIKVKDIADTLKRPVFMAIPEDGDTIWSAVDEGVPIVVGQNQKQPVSKAMIKLADMIRRELANEEDATEEVSIAEQKGKTGKLRLFGKS
jgi:pilus assembly protein CpaE